ncbi:hypothetical protein KKH15_01685 [Patescibacteria group bacterium]|nr:hypothetical protein [Patescibacteria group bacterium]MBU1755062.1 hypothetical protein [Patescibacteria group bacterium]
MRTRTLVLIVTVVAAVIIVPFSLFAQTSNLSAEERGAAPEAVGTA